MNIFVLDENPVRAAADHCDKHVVKMIVESAQLLSFVHHRYGTATSRMYKYSKGHVNHPCTVWAAETKGNYLWLLELAWALSAEYTDRYHRIHKSTKVLRHLKHPPKACPDKKRTPFVLCMPEELHEENAVEAYRDFYVTKKFTHNNYSHGPTPLWLLRRIGEH